MSLLQLAQSMVGTKEGEAKLADYLHTGGQNLDPVSKAWCASFINATLQQSGYGGTGSDLAKSFLNYGSQVDPTGVQPGDIAVYNRGADPTYGHAGIVQAYDPKTGMVTLISGNAGNAVSMQQRALADAIGYRRPGGAQSQMGPAANTPVQQYTPEQRRNAIASIESAGSGDYGALGVWTGDPESGRDRAYGRYQIMGKNIPLWSKEVLGRVVTPDEFMADPKLQDAIFDAKFGQYVQKHGEMNAAQAWFGGEGSIGKGNLKDALGTTIDTYGNKYMKALGAPGGEVTTPGAATMQPEGSQAPATPGTEVAAAKPKTLAETLKAGAGDLLKNFGSIAGGGQTTALPRSTVPQAGVPLKTMPIEAMAAGDTSAQDALRTQLAQRMALLNSGKLWG